MVSVHVGERTWLLPVYSVSLHQGLARRAVHALKYEGKRVLAEPMAAEMVGCLGSTAAKVDWVIPVPLHRSRQRERGFNQAELLARGLTAHLRLPLVGDCLVRVRDTSPQVGLSVAERKGNMEGAFRAHARMREQALLLVDDVCTTGATIAACAAAAAAAGGVPVAAVTFTRAGPGMDI
ncbi:MAG: ComF family protein [Anaerolineae bacterium]|nr:ComF family protein [Anaerolineae bacterium]